jgi:hypothetical protein
MKDRSDQRQQACAGRLRILGKLFPVEYRRVPSARKAPWMRRSIGESEDEAADILA